MSDTKERALVVLQTFNKVEILSHTIHKYNKQLSETMDSYLKSEVNIRLRELDKAIEFYNNSDQFDVSLEKRAYRNLYEFSKGILLK